MAQEVTFSGTIEVHINGCTNLAKGDITSSDPYCVTNLSNKAQFLGTHKTKVVPTNLNPDWKEVFRIPVYQVESPITVDLSVWDKDNCFKDDFLGHVDVEITPNSNNLGKETKSALVPRKNKKESIKVTGDISYKVNFLPGVYHGHNAFKYHNHKFTGLARSMSSKETARIYGTYQIELFHVRQVFGNSWQEWNKKYEAAQKIFGSPIIKSTITTQHNHLYSDISISKKGVLKNGTDLLDLLKNGYKGGKRRFFTYVIKDDTWYFSETGAAFFVDFTSKHAMHATVSEQVRYAGEFHFHKKEDGSFMLVIDNNSGTYAPDKNLLPNLKLLMELNFPGLEVEVLDFHEEKLKKYKEDMEKESSLRASVKQ